MVLVGEWELQQNLGPAALRYEIDCPAQHCRPFSHTLNPQAVREDSRGLSVKPTSVIDYCYFQRRRQTRESYADRLGSRMFGYVGQGFLENAVQTNLDCWRKVAGVKFIKCEIHGYVVGLCVLGNVSAQCNTQAMVVQHCWVKAASELENCRSILDSC